MKSRLFMAAASLLISLSTLAGSYNFEQVRYTPAATTFTAIAQDAKQVKLRLYADGIGGKALKTVNMQRAADGSWRATVQGDWKGKFYTFDVKNGKRFNGECAGIFAKAVGVNGRRGAVVDMDNTDPEGWSIDRRPDIKPQDLILYEMHHRDFSIDPSSGITHKGKFLALTEPKALEHLKLLGVNAVHILPSFDYASVDETRLDMNKYNWGYDPLNYNVPEGSYSTNPYDPESRIREFKQMVQALHKAGIKVVLDVVYNHTFSIDDSNFQLTNPDAFFRRNDDGSYSNGSGCGNETASERDIMRQYMIESVRYWIDEYHIDGFRFDLMGIHDITTMNAIRAAVPADIFIYGEGWSAGSCAYPYEQLGMKGHIKQMPGIAAFSDEMRDALRGPFSDDTKPAFLAGLPGNEESIKMGIAGAIDHPQIDYSKVNYTKEPWALQPTQMISYVSCHDDMCLVDRIKASMPGISQNDLIELDLLAQTAVFTSQGVPFMLSGEEMLRDKKGVHNSFESPDSINHLDWNNLKRYPNVFKYYQGLIALRKHHPAFHLGDANLVRKHLEFLPSPDATVAFMLKNHAGGDQWNNIIVILNGSKRTQKVSVPYNSYVVVASCGQIDENGFDTISADMMSVPAMSAMIIHD